MLYSYFAKINLYRKEQLGFVPEGRTVKAGEAVVENILSDFEEQFKNVLTWVPQGSLCPVLFLLAVNDLVFSVPYGSVLYAEMIT